VLCGESLQHPRKKIVRRESLDRYANDAAGRARGAVELSLDASELVEQVARSFDEAPTGYREYEAPSYAIEQSDPEPPLELGELVTHRRLRQVQARCRPRGTSFVGESPNELQVPHLEHSRHHEQFTSYHDEHALDSSPITPHTPVMTNRPSEHQNEFRETSPGVSSRILRRHDDRGLTFLVRMQPGSRAPTHGHAGGEETYLLRGSLRIVDRTDRGGTLLPDVVLSEGQYFFAPPGETHSGVAEGETAFLVVAPGGVQRIV
jgi:quercetin dioxygenase-like cupin family protein